MKMPSYLRTFLEHSLRGRVFKRTLSVGNRRAEIFVTPDAQLKYVKIGRAPYDQDLINLSFTCLEPQDVVWDVGANIGVFSVAAATFAKTVVAFEADIWLAELIRRTAKIKDNRDLDIQVVPAALSDRCGLSKFQIAKRGRASNALSSAGGRSQMGGVREEVLVPTFDLDAMVQELGPPDFIKIDVEGAEMMVISGGQALFQEYAPLVYIEVGNEMYTEIAQFFQKHGYTIFDERAAPLEDGSAPTPNLFFAKDVHMPRLERLRHHLKPNG